MNKILENFAKEWLIKQLVMYCSEDQQHMFKRMYSHNNTKLSIREVVNAMPSDKLDHAMAQVQNSMEKLK